MPFKYVQPEKKNKKNKTSTVEMRKHKRQYTKSYLNSFLVLLYVVIVSSCYVNLKNGFSMDTIAVEFLKICSLNFSSYCLKSYFETKEERKHELEVLKLKNGIDDINNQL